MLQREAADEIFVSQRREHRPGSLLGHGTNVGRPRSSIVEAHIEAVASEITGFLDSQQHDSLLTPRARSGETDRWSAWYSSYPATPPDAIRPTPPPGSTPWVAGCLPSRPESRSAVLLRTGCSARENGAECVH